MVFRSVCKLQNRVPEEQTVQVRRRAWTVPGNSLTTLIRYAVGWKKTRRGETDNNRGISKAINKVSRANADNRKVNNRGSKAKRASKANAGSRVNRDNQVSKVRRMGNNKGANKRAEPRTADNHPVISNDTEDHSGDQWEATGEIIVNSSVNSYKV